MAKRASTRTSKTKSEVQAEFENIKNVVLDESLNVSHKQTESESERESEIRERVSGLTVEKSVRDISNLNIEISRALSQLSAQLVEKIDTLDSIKEAIDIETKELQRMHKIDIAATAMDQMVAEYSSKKKELEEEIVIKTQEWETLQSQKTFESKEYDENLKKSRLREKEDFEYNKNLERKKEQDKYDESQRVLVLKNKEKQDLLEKSWAEREQTIKLQEDEYKQLKREVEGYPEKIKKAVEQTILDTVKETEQKYQQQILIMQKEIESDRKISELKIKSLEELVSRQFTEIEVLHNRLEEAKKQVQDIAVKAIESTSGSRALNHVNQIAMEQAKNRPQV